MMKKLSEWLAATTPIKCVEDCSICRKIPAYCSRLEKGGELVGDDIPEDVNRLEGFLDSVKGWRGDVMRCPECHRPYYYESEYEFLIGGSEDTWSYRRVDPEELFRGDWFIRYRIGRDNLDQAWSQHAFPQHAIAKLRDGTWIALHDEGEVTPLASSADLRRLGPSALCDERSRSAISTSSSASTTCVRATRSKTSITSCGSGRSPTRRRRRSSTCVPRAVSRPSKSSGSPIACS
jgi:hypothetical protein